MQRCMSVCLSVCLSVCVQARRVWASQRSSTVSFSLISIPKESFRMSQACRYIHLALSLSLCVLCFSCRFAPRCSTTYGVCLGPHTWLETDRQTDSVCVWHFVLLPCCRVHSLTVHVVAGCKQWVVAVKLSVEAAQVVLKNEDDVSDMAAQTEAEAGGSRWRLMFRWFVCLFVCGALLGVLPLDWVTLYFAKTKV